MILNNLYEFFNDELNKDYLLEYKASLSDYLLSQDFKTKLNTIIKDRNLSVFSLSGLLTDFLDKYDNMPLEKWIENIYRWTINKSFPNKYVNSFNPDFIGIYKFFLNLLGFFIKNYGELLSSNFINNHPISFLSKYEESNLNRPEEYLIFKNTFEEYYINELLYLDMAISGHNTLDHIIGVNYLSVYIGRQLHSLGYPVDLGVVVGSSLGHDIGKYGVLPEDHHKVPYYHYYYTEEWFKRFNMNRIGHIATNHSTWDLELETLPIESLILIYSDFRVKNKMENNIHSMNIFPLHESFHIILDKLDNVDDVKENRYKKVYKKLRDFEDFILSLGVDITLNSCLTKPKKKPFEFMNNKEIINNLKFMAIDHNINVMSRLTDDVSFDSILEMARGENNWRQLRLYLEIFKEYSNYLTQKQKITTLHFLSDLLLHSGEDIRKESAELIGKLIGLFDEEYRKELPESIIFNLPQTNSKSLLEGFLDTLLFPSHKIADSQIEWLYNLKNIIKSLFEESPKSKHKGFFNILSKYYYKYKDLSTIGQFYLSQTINYIPLDSLGESNLLVLYDYILKQLDSNNFEIRLSTLDIIQETLYDTNNIIFIASIRNWIISNLDKSGIPGENYLKYIIGLQIDISPNYQKILTENYLEDESNTPDIFLENLKTATEWIRKKVNIDILYDQVIKSPSTKGLHTSMHLCNLLKVSAVERVRNYAGVTLLNIFPLLSLEESNDVAVELLRALEMESYQFTKFIPDYLGQLLLYLPPTELDEIIDDFEIKIKTSSSRVVSLLLNTIVISIENYSFYIDKFQEPELVHDDRLDRLLGLLSISMASYSHDEKNESLRVLSSVLLNSKKLDSFTKYNILGKISKKIITLLNSDYEDDFLFYNNAASLNHIYRFISDYEFDHGHSYSEDNKNIAFFPGSFDPFSLSHKEIAIEIRNLGFQVYLAIDEFSWSKRTEAHNFRRDIVNMSIANEKDIYLFPQNIPINISNSKDLNKLRDLFSEKDIFIVVGSDVLINASAYKKESPILDFSHILFDRKSSISERDDEDSLKLSLQNIRGEIIRLTLPPQYEDISSSQIRENIDSNRDISKFIDPLAQSYIYDHGLYLRQPQYKTLLETKTIEIEILRFLDNEVLDEILEIFRDTVNIKHLQSLRQKLSYRVLLVRDVKERKLLGFSIFYWVRHNMLYEEFEDSTITDYIRTNVKGRTVLISGIVALNNDEELLEIVLNETLSVCLNRDYNYAIYYNNLTKKVNHKLEKQIILQGFLNTNLTYNESLIFMVDMNSPSSLNYDLENMLKPPYNTNIKIKDAIRETRKNLKRVISGLYPGELLLTNNRDTTYSKLIQKICDVNGVNIYQKENRILGPSMCVPFGSILNSSIIPNTVTKTLHTEKIFQQNIKDFTIGPFPHYLSLKEQVEILKSFNRPIILVDDLLHKGYRLNVIEPILRNAGIEIEKIIVGLLSSRGEELANIKNLKVDSAYFVPNLKLWFNESSQYPFIGGDMVEDHLIESSLIPSVNMILPYVSPSFIKNTTNDALYELSETCLDNSYIIFKAIEEVYQSINQKNLNIKGLGEVLISSRHPDINNKIDFSKNIKPSVSIKKDLDYLRRLENVIRR